MAVATVLITLLVVLRLTVTARQQRSSRLVDNGQ